MWIPYVLATLLGTENNGEQNLVPDLEELTLQGRRQTITCL